MAEADMDMMPAVTPDARWLTQLAHINMLPAIGLDQAWECVRDFHQVMGQKCPDRVEDQTPAEVTRRANWQDSEVQELRDATNISERADAYMDQIYFALGGLVELGIRPQPLFDLVHGANMNKVQPDGTVHRTHEGKIIKPAHWSAPDAAIAEEIVRQASTPVHTECNTCASGAG